MSCELDELHHSVVGVEQTLPEVKPILEILRKYCHEDEKGEEGCLRFTILSSRCISQRPPQKRQKDCTKEDATCPTTNTFSEVSGIVYSIVFYKHLLFTLCSWFADLVVFSRAEGVKFSAGSQSPTG